MAEKYLREVVSLTTEAHFEVYQAKMKDADIKGNRQPTDGMTIGAFDGSIEVKVTKPDNLFFDNTYTNMVKEKFNEYFATFGTDSEDTLFLRDIVNDLLYTSGGKMDQSKVFKLRKYRERLMSSKKLSEKSSLFIAAVDLFDKAIRTKTGNMGIYVSERDENGTMRRVAIKYTDI